MSKPKVIAIVGTTASGKTQVAVELAFQYNGEVVSADSRQVYKYMDIGTGKDLEEYEIIRDGKKVCVPYHMIDVAHPKDNYNLAMWLKEAKKAINDILKRGKVPIIAGGTGLYIQALLDNFDLTKVKEDYNLRKEMEQLDTEHVFLKLKELDEEFAMSLNESDSKNKRRLIRYIEMIKSEGKIEETPKKEKEYEALVIGLTWPRDILRDRIKERLKKRKNDQGLIEEVINLRNEHGLNWERLDSFGLEYRYIAKYLLGELDQDEMLEKLYFAICQFSKRQMTWLRRWEKQGTKIFWENDLQKINKKVNEFLT